MFPPPPRPTLFPYTTLFRSTSSSARRSSRCRSTSRAAIRPSSIAPWAWRSPGPRSEEHTSELQSRGHLVCRLLLEKKNHRHLVGADADEIVIASHVPRLRDR